jgi:hypothetical protein
MDDRTSAGITIMSRIQKLFAQSLIVTALGPLYNDILLFRVGSFVVTGVHLALAVTVIAAFMCRRRINGILALIVLAMILLEISHALLFGFVSKADWLKSFAQYLVYTTSFVLLAGVVLDHADLREIAPWVRKCALIFGGLGLVQFLLYNLGISAALPISMRIRVYDPFSDPRAGGLVPIQGLATEPSYFAIGLVTLLALILFLDATAGSPVKGLSRSAVPVLLAAIVVTFSMTGIIAAAAVICARIAVSSRADRVRTVILTCALAALLIASGMVRPLRERLDKIAVGADDSALVRVELGAKLFLAPARDVEEFFLGTGLGMEARCADEYFRLYREVSLNPPATDQVKIHNFPTAIKYFQGWTGLLLYGALLGTMLLVLRGSWRPYVVLLCFLIVFHFASGLYLAPGTWAMFALWTLLRRSQLSMIEPPEPGSHSS